jgi:hypothetical protein
LLSRLGVLLIASVVVTVLAVAATGGKANDGSWCRWPRGRGRGAPASQERALGAHTRAVTASDARAAAAAVAGGPQDVGQ